MPPRDADFDPAKLERAVEGVEKATQAIEKTRADMDGYNKQVTDLLARQKQIENGAQSSEKEVADIKAKLSDLADKMTAIAEQHTNFTNTTRQFMKQTGQNSDTSDRGYVWKNPNSKGSIFRSKQEATEIGMYFMATMKRECPAKQYARTWLKDHKQDLRYMPGITPSLVQHLGNEWVEAQRQLDRQLIGAGAQDLTGGAIPGSVFVRPEFAATLIRNVEEQGVGRQECLIWPMGSDIAYIPKRTGGTSVYWEGEGESTTSSDPNYTMLALTVKKAMSFHQYSSELSEDAAISIADLLMFEIALAHATEEDRIIFNGTGAGGNSPGFAGYFGLLGMSANATEATAISSNVPRLVSGGTNADRTDEVTLAKLRAMTGLLPTWGRQGSKWYMHRTVHADLDGIETTGGGPVTKYEQGGGASALGYPIRDVDAMPASPGTASTRVFALGNLRKAAVLGDRRQMTVDTSEHYAFNTDKLSVRSTSRWGILWAQADAMVVYATAS